MNDFEAQWQKLSSTSYSGGRLRVYPDHILNFFIDFSLSGKRELIIESNASTFEFPELPIFENLELVAKPINNGFCIGITLTDSDLFSTCINTITGSNIASFTSVVVATYTNVIIDAQDGTC